MHIPKERCKYRLKPFGFLLPSLLEWLYLHRVFSGRSKMYNKYVTSSLAETIDDVVDELPHPSIKENHISQIVEDEFDSERDHIHDSKVEQDQQTPNDCYTSNNAHSVLRKTNRRKGEHENGVEKNYTSSRVNANGSSPNSRSTHFYTHSDSVPNAYNIFTGQADAFSFVANNNENQVTIIKDGPSLNTSWCIDELSDVDDSVSCVGMKNLGTQPSTTSAPNANHHFKTIDPPEYSSAAPTSQTNYVPLKRSNSVGSDCTDLILGDAEQLVTHIGNTSSESKTKGLSHTFKEYSMSMHNLSTSAASEHRRSTTQQPRHQTSSKTSKNALFARDLCRGNEVITCLFGWQNLL